MPALALALVLAAAAAPPAPSGIRFLHDDYPAALEQARRERKLLFVDAWAAWCHTCLSMQRFVFPDPALAPLREAVVWLALDTENPKNKPFLERNDLHAWPTFFLVEPTGERTVGRWLGAAHAGELKRFIESALPRAQAPPAAPAAGLSAALDRALVADAAGDHAAAAEAWERVVAGTPAGDPQRRERLVALASALLAARAPQAARRCTELGERELDATGDSATATDFAALVNACARDLPAGDPAVPRLRERSIARLQKLVADPLAPLGVDDRSDAYANLVELLDDAGRHDQALERARARGTLLERAAAAAPDAERAAVFDAHRVEVHLYLGEPAKAQALLAERERQLPADYSTPARLARVLLERGDLAGAEAAVERALAKTPRARRRLGTLDLQVKILAAAGKPVAPVLEEKLRLFDELPAPQRPAPERAALERDLAAARLAERREKRP